MGKSLVLLATPGGDNLLNGTFSPLGGGMLDRGTEAQTQFPVRIAGTFSLLAGNFNNDGNSRVLRSRKNGGNGNQSVSPSNGASGFHEDASNSDSVTAGDLVNFGYSRSGASSNAYGFRLVFEASSGHAALYAASLPGSFSTDSSAAYFCLGGVGGNSTTEANKKFKARVAGTLTNAFVDVQSNARSTTSNWKSRINGSDGSINIAVGSGLTGLFEDTSNSDAFSAGDDLNWALSTSTGGGSISFDTYGGAISASSAANDLIASHNGTSRTASGTAGYIALSGDGTSNATESRAQMQHGFAGTASRLRIYVSANTCTGDVTVRFRKGGADGNQVVTIPAGTTGLFEDTSNTDAFVASDACNISIVGGTANSLTYQWFGLTETVTPPVQDLTPGLFTNSQTFHAPTVSATYGLAPALVSNSQSFYAPTVTPGAVTLAPELVTNDQTFYAPEITSGWQVTPPLITNDQTFYAATITTGAVGLTASLVTNSQTFYAATVTVGAVTLSPSLVTNDQAFYSATITTGAVTVAPPLYTNSQTFYGPAVTSVYPLAPSLLTNSQTFYGASIAVAPVYLTPSLFTNTQTFFQHSFRAITGKSASTTVSVTGQGAGQTVSGWVGKTSEEAVSGWVGKSAA